MSQLILIGSTHHTAPLQVREKLAVNPEDVDRFYEGLKHLPGVGECLLLNTCNRTEVYAVAEYSQARHQVEDYMCGFIGFSHKEYAEVSFAKSGSDAIEHLFAVSSGLESQMVGETEILGQVKQSYQQASSLKVLGPILHKTFQKSFQTAKWIRSNTAISKGQVSIGNVAVDLATRIFGDLRRSRVLAVGSGEVGEKTVKSLKSRGAKKIAVTSRTFAKAEALAREVDGHPVEFERFTDSLRQSDILVCSTAARDVILRRGEIELAMKKRPDQPLFIIDLAVPRDVEQSAADIANVFLYNMDDMAHIANENLRQRMAELDRCREFISERARQFWDQLVPASSSLPPQQNNGPAPATNS